MAGKIQPINQVFKGESKTLEVTILDDKDAPVDLTGFAIEFEVNAPVGPPYEAVIAKSVASGGITIITPQSGVTKGKCHIQLNPADTKDLHAKTYKYDVVTVDGSGYRRIVIAPSDFVLKEPVNGA